MAVDSNLIELNCPKCNAPIAFLSNDAGQKGKCPDCGVRFIIPARNSKSQVIPKIDTSDLPPSKPKPTSFRLPCSDRSSLDNPLDIFCPRCHKLLTFSYDDLWNKGTCPDCGSYFTITDPDHVAQYLADVKSGVVRSDVSDSSCVRSYPSVHYKSMCLSPNPAFRRSSPFRSFFAAFSDVIGPFLFSAVFLTLLIYNFLDSCNDDQLHGSRLTGSSLICISFLCTFTFASIATFFLLIFSTFFNSRPSVSPAQSLMAFLLSLLFLIGSLFLKFSL